MLIAKFALLIKLFFALMTTNQSVFREGLVGQPQNLVPFLGKQNEVDETLSSLLYPQLLSYDLKGELTPSFSKSWLVSDDGLSYELRLKENVFWSNGRRIDADDIIFTSQNNPEIKNIAVQKLDEFNLRFSLKEPYAPFLSLLTFPIIPRETNPGIRPITLATRPILKEVKSGQRVDQIIIGNLGGKDNRIRFLAFKFYDRFKDLKVAADLAEIDGFYATAYENSAYFSLPLILESRRYGIFFNTKNDALKDSEIRKKLALAIDKKIVIQEALDGLGEIVNLPELENNGSQDLKDLSLTLTTDNTEDHLKIVALIKEMWEKSGAAVTILPFPFWDISTRVIDTKDFQALLFGQEVGRSDDEYTLWHSTKTTYPGLNICQISNQRIDESLEGTRKALDPEKYQEYKDNFQLMLAEEVPAVFLYHPVYNWYISKRLEKDIKNYVVEKSCCDGCVCQEFVLPEIYYPQERFNLLPL